MAETIIGREREAGAQRVPVIITPQGLQLNGYAKAIPSVLTLDDLFSTQARAQVMG